MRHWRERRREQASVMQLYVIWFGAALVLFALAYAL